MRVQVMVQLVILAMLASAATAQNDLAERAKRIHAEAFVMDTHADTTTKFEDPEWDFSARHEEGHVDLPRLREGGYDAVFWAIWMGKTPGDGTATKKAIKRIDSVHEMIRKFPDDLMLATTAADIRAAAAQNKIACLMGVEGGHIIEDELAVLRTYHSLGVRYMTLTHSFNTNWGDSAGTDMPVEPEHNGLTEFGKEVVTEMNRLGMMVDISHVSDSTFWDALEVSKAPLLASHSSCRALADHPRNMSDEMIKAMAEKGGVIQINFYTGYMDPEKIRLAVSIRPTVLEIREKYADDPDKMYEEEERVYLEAFSAETPASIVVDHIEHVIKIAGADHVGLGADWDGVEQLPVGLEDCSKISYITKEMLARGHDEETIKKVLGGNMLRLMEGVEQTAASMR